jgi:proteasome lid subunit RPN8/RPN11
LSRELRAAIVAHAREAAPDEACGLLAGRDGVATRAIRCRNVAEDKPRKYLMDSDDLRRALASMDDAGETDADGNPGEPLAIYHSHVRSEARPSATDIADAARWPHSFYVLVSLTHQPELAAWRIERGEVTPATLVG